MDEDWLPPLPDELPRVLGYSDFARFGITSEAAAHRVRVGRWRRLLPRTYLTSDTVTWFDKVAAALAFAGDGAVLSGARDSTVSAYAAFTDPSRCWCSCP